MKILRLVFSKPLYQFFDYLAPDDYSGAPLSAGTRVRVPWGKKQETIGFLLETTSTSALPLDQLKKAVAILDDSPILPDAVLKLINWASHYYHYPLGHVFSAALPRLLRKGARATSRKKVVESTPITTSTIPQLNTHQQSAVEAIINQLNQFQCFLLNGVTGSGKTEVYLHIIAAVLKKNKQALVLVPEISLIPQTAQHLRERFTVPVILLHSALTQREQLDHWLLAKSVDAVIVIGTRSALFAPLSHLGVIIVDEEHDLSFKQGKNLRYSARDLAVVRAQFENIPVVLGSATPSLETLHNVQKNRYQVFRLPERAGRALLPDFQLIDLRNQKLDQGLSRQLITRMQEHLQNQGQVLLFLNRRGFSPVYICHACGWVAHCHYCDAKMILHKHPPLLQCHHCNHVRSVDTICPQCQNTVLFPLGLGTQRLEQVLKIHFPDTSLVRIDRDNTRRKGTLHTLLDSVSTGEARILIGTQLLAKGHHFPNITLVGILEADTGLFSADFRATERLAQLLTQVAGRTGRTDKQGEVLIQTYNPQHPLLQLLLAKDYLSFTEVTLQERQSTKLPPYSHLALLRAEAVNAALPLQFLSEAKQIIAQLNAQIHLLGPIPSMMPRCAGRTRAQLLLRSDQRQPLQQTLKQVVTHLDKLPTARRVRWSLDVDPLELV